MSVDRLACPSCTSCEFGLSCWPLVWKPVSVVGCIAPAPTASLRAAVFARYLPPQAWTRCRANPKLFLRTLIQRIPGLDPDALVDLFDYRRSGGPEEAAATCALRVRAEACGALLAGSGSEGLFIKDFSNNGTVEWQKPLPGEMPRAFLYRVLRLSGQQRLAGLAFSATGSLGLRRVAGAMPSSCAANGFSCGTPRSALLSFLSDQQWRDVVLSSTTNRRAFLQLFFRGRPPLNSAVAPWEYAVDDGMCVTISPWQSISRPRLVEKLFTPPFRQATPVVVPPTAALAPCIADVEMTDPRTQGQTAVAPCLDGPPLKHRRCLPAAEVNLEALVLTKVTNSRAGHCLIVALLQSLESCRDSKWKKHLVPKTAKDAHSQVVSGLLTMERSLAGWFDRRVPASRPCHLARVLR